MLDESIQEKNQDMKVFILENKEHNIHNKIIY